MDGKTVIQAIGTFLQGTYDTQAARELSRVEAQLSRERHDFFNLLQLQRDTGNYTKALTDGFDSSVGYVDGLYSKYDEILASIENGEAKNRVARALHGIKEKDRQDAIKLSQQNAVTFGGEELLTTLNSVISRGPSAVDTLVGEETYQDKILGEIQEHIGMAYGAGIISSDEAMKLNEEYTNKFMNGFATNMTNQAIDIMLDGGLGPSETMETIEDVIRYGQVKEVDVSETAQRRLQTLADAYGNVVLTPEDKEELVNHLRREVPIKLGRRAQAAEEVKAANEIAFATEFHGPQWERLADNNFDAIKQMGAGDDGWVAEKIGKVQKKLETEREKNVLRDFNRKLERLYGETATIQDVETVREQVLAADIPDAEADQMLDDLRKIEDVIREREQTPVEDTDKRTWLQKQASYDREIFEAADRIRTGQWDGLTESIKDIRSRINQDEDMIMHPTEREQDLNDIEGLLNKLHSESERARRQVDNEAAIWQLYISNTPWETVQKRIDDYVANGMISARAGAYWTNMQQKRDEMRGDTAATDNLSMIHDGFEARMRRAESDEEILRLMESYTLTLERYRDKIESQAYRDATDAEKLVMMKEFRQQVLQPLESSTFFGSFGPAATEYEKFRELEEVDPTAFQYHLADLRSKFIAEIDDPELERQMREPGGFRYALEDIDELKEIVFTQESTGDRYVYRKNWRGQWRWEKLDE